MKCKYCGKEIQFSISSEVPCCTNVVCQGNLVGDLSPNCFKNKIF